MPSGDGLVQHGGGELAVVALTIGSWRRATSDDGGEGAAAEALCSALLLLLRGGFDGRGAGRTKLTKLAGVSRKIAIMLHTAAHFLSCAAFASVS